MRIIHRRPRGSGFLSPFILAASFVLVIHALSLTDENGLIGCSLNCAVNNLAALKCTASDTACICDRESFFNNFDDCTDSCDLSNAADGLNAYVDFCSSAEADPATGSTTFLSPTTSAVGTPASVPFSSSSTLTPEVIALTSPPSITTSPIITSASETSTPPLTSSPSGRTSSSLKPTKTSSAPAQTSSSTGLASASSVHIGPIVGGAVAGSVAITALAFGLAWFLCHRRHQNRATVFNNAEIETTSGYIHQDYKIAAQTEVVTHLLTDLPRPPPPPPPPPPSATPYSNTVVTAPAPHYHYRGELESTPLYRDRAGTAPAPISRNTVEMAPAPHYRFTGELDYTPLPSDRTETAPATPYRDTVETSTAPHYRDRAEMESNRPAQ